MAWLKRNLGLVITGVISLGLLGLATYYLLMKKASADDASTKLQAATEQLQSLVNRNPGVSVENIAAAKQDQKKIEDFNAEVKRFFVPPSYPTQMNNRDFGVHLYDKINELRRGAKAAGVTLPADFQFSFASQMKVPNIASSALAPLAVQLAEIESICKVLFHAKIQELEAVRRPSVTSDETAGIGDFLSTKADTNEFTIVTPYDVKFKAFSGDLANVLEGLIKSVNCIAVSNIVVQRADAVQTNSETSYYNPMTSQGGSASPYSRYGMRGMSREMMMRYGLRPPPQTPQATPSPQPSTTKSGVIQDEHQLDITLSLVTVRNNIGGKVPKAPPPAPLDPAAQAPLPPTGAVAPPAPTE